MIFLDLKQFNRHKVWCAVHAVQSLLSISYIVLALPSTLTKLSNKTLIFHDFQGPTINFYDFPGLENEMLKFHDFPGFPWHVQTLPHGMKIPGGWGVWSKSALRGEKSIANFTLKQYYSLKIEFVPCHHQRVKVNEVAKFENSRLLRDQFPPLTIPAKT